ncbi:MAG TPA: DEAD/DEAH box helicase [Nannocystaceae bacterium]|nr:DEAD/DEAH box helicase [Nannocystaceae bacterium]
MDVFNLRRKVIDDYAAYMRSFIEIADPRVADLVTQRLPSLWPEPLLQLNPAFEPAESLRDLISDGLLHPACADIFQHRTKGAPARPLRLYRHQVDGIRAARAGDNYVLTTGTGSGKSLSYIVPIVDHVLRARAEGRRGIQAIVVYPMNALANSQREELRKYLGEIRPLVTFDRYTGQEDDAARDRIRQSPPDILLTNYVMLELILTRPDERRLIEHAQDLRFLVLDELHTYRGRQGADVAMLCRRVREACRATRLIHIGTSATLASEGTWDDQRRQVAEIATTIFGALVEPRRVIGETLRRLTPELDLDDPGTRAALHQRVVDPRPLPTTAAFLADPLASWIESILGLRLHEGRLVRQRPRALHGPGGIAHELARQLALSADRCADAIRQVLLEGNLHTHEERPPGHPPGRLPDPAPCRAWGALRMVIHAPHIAVFGGLLTKIRHRLADTGVRCFGGAKHSGNGELQRLITALRAGTITEVLILWRWLGHSEVTRLIDTCKTLGVTYVLVGGLSAIRQHLRAPPRRPASGRSSPS